MPPKKITLIKIERPKRKYTRKGDAAIEEEPPLPDSTPTTIPAVEENGEGGDEREEIHVAQPTKVQVKRLDPLSPWLINGQQEIEGTYRKPSWDSSSPEGCSASRHLSSSPSILSEPAKPIPLDQVTFALSEKPMDVYIYFTIEPLSASFTKYQFYASQYKSLFDHVICYSGPTPPPDYPHSHAVYRESQTIHPMITLHIKVFYVAKQDYTWKVCTENLAKNDRSEYGYHFTQFRMMAGGYLRTRPDYNQKFAVLHGETHYIQLPTLNLEEFREKSALQIRELNEGLKRLGI